MPSKKFLGFRGHRSCGCNEMPPLIKKSAELELRMQRNSASLRGTGVADATKCHAFFLGWVVGLIRISGTGVANATKCHDNRKTLDGT
jgi:hypothetical protein